MTAPTDEAAIQRRLWIALRDARISQAEVSRRTGISEHVLSRRFLGSPFRAGEIAKITTAINMDVRALLYGDNKADWPAAAS